MEARTWDGPDTSSGVKSTGSRLVVLGSAGRTNTQLVAAWTAQGMRCTIADADFRPQDRDIILGRLDVLPTLDGVEPGLLRLLWAERSGAIVLNRARALLTTHDKLRTVAALSRANLPHPLTGHLRPHETASPPAAPVVLKPRFGSWGRDVRFCRTDREVADYLHEITRRAWFRRHGVLAQEVIPSRGFDLRLLVAGSRVVGATERHPRPGEWRTNVAVGAVKRTAVPDAHARALAVAAAEAVGADLVGVDLMPLPDGDYTVIELNGAVDFDRGYRHESDIFAAVSHALGLTVPSRRGRHT